MTLETLLKHILIAILLATIALMLWTLCSLNALSGLSGTWIALLTFAISAGYSVFSDLNW